MAYKIINKKEKKNSKAAVFIQKIRKDGKFDGLKRIAGIKKDLKAAYSEQYAKLSLKKLTAKSKREKAMITKQLSKLKKEISKL